MGAYCQCCSNERRNDTDEKYCETYTPQGDLQFLKNNQPQNIVPVNKVKDKSNEELK